MFNNINYLKSGNETQKLAYNAIKKLGIMNSLSEYRPTLCGTIPICVDIKGSDLDIIMETYDLKVLEKKVETLYGNKELFKLKRLIIREEPVVKANFIFDGFEFELFAQSKPVKEQNAYLHMIIEHAIMEQVPTIRTEVMNLKKRGLKTEQAFCEILGLEGDPYASLLNYGRQKGII